MSETGGQNGKAEPDRPDELERLLPGDQAPLGAGQRQAVRTVLLCSEEIGSARTEWQWIFLEDGSLLELAPKGRYRYEQHAILPRGTAAYEELVAQDGALVRFEAHVRAGEADRRPTHVTFEGRRYRIVSTGTVRAQRLGAEPPLAPWAALSSEPDQNVYFNLVEADEPANVVLGLWTTQVALSFGRALASG